jgi:lipopolysaccharide transport system ATP-binding protein
MMQNKDEVLISCQQVKKRFCRDLKKSLWYGLLDMGQDLFGREKTNTPNVQLRDKEFWAMDDVSFELRQGEALGLIGHNGAGKTTLLKMLNGLLKPDSGRIEVKGRVGALIALGAGFNPILTGRENVYINGSILGLKKKQIEEKFDSIIAFAELEEFIDTPVQNYSSGMQVRLGFAVAAHMRPDILLIDEVLAVGDARFTRKCHKFIADYVKQGGAYILVTHNLMAVHNICSRAIVLDRGKVAFIGPAAQAVSKATQLQQSSALDIMGNAGQGESENPSLKVEKCQILTGGSSPLHPNKPVTVEVHYQAEDTFTKAVLAFGIWNQEGTRICSCCSKNQNQFFDLTPGKGVFRCHIDNLPLAPGSYALRGAVMDSGIGANLAQFGFHDTLATVKVLPSGNLTDSYSSGIGDVVVLKPTWSTTC